MDQVEGRPRGLSRFHALPLFLGFPMMLTAPYSSADTSYPFPQRLTYSPATIRPSHRTQAQLDEDVRQAYVRWKGYYLAQVGNEAGGSPRYRVRKGIAAGSETVSEGQGFGMILAALMAGFDPDARIIFDGLWYYFDDHRSAGDSRLMDWTVPADELANTPDSSAFDGDADIAYGLLLADKQWGVSGPIQYRNQAEQVMTGILASEIGPQSHLPMLGDWVNPGGSTHNQYTPRTSDFMTGHYRSFARASGNTTWSDVAAACQSAITSLQMNHSPDTGLLPDFAVPVSDSDHTPKPAPPSFLEGPNDGNYYYNAGRDPWRIGTDAVLNQDATSRAQAQKISEWARTAAGGNPQNIRG